jgi:hypothetical protein
MKNVRRNIVAAMIAMTLIFQSVAWAGLDSKKCAYHGGTVGGLNEGAKEAIEGTLQTGETELIFTPDKTTRPQLRIPYQLVTDIEYGQKAGRRVGASVATAVLISPVGLFMLFSKKRKHFMTVSWKGGDGKEQVAVLELGKDIIRTTLAITQTKSGKSVTYQDEEAQKSSKG